MADFAAFSRPERGLVDGGREEGELEGDGLEADAVLACEGRPGVAPGDVGGRRGLVLVVGPAGEEAWAGKG